MSLTRADLRRLRLPIAAALVLVAAGAAGVVTVDHFATRAQQGRDAAAKQRNEAQKRLDQVAEEEREIRQNLVYYDQMVNRGMTNPENRLDLIDAITRIRNERRLFEMKYSIDSQKPLDYPGISPSGTLDLAASRMKIDMLLLHEEDLLHFMDDLSRVVHGHVALRQCTMARVETGAPPGLALVPRLRADCEVDLIVVRRGGAA